MVSTQPIFTASLNAAPSVFLTSTTKPVARRKTVDERLEDFFKDSRIGERRRLENFRGDRKIEAYRGKQNGQDFINKLTTKFETETTPELYLIRNMKPVKESGSKTPRWLDNATVLVVDKGRSQVQVYRDTLGKSQDGILVKIFRTYNQSVIRHFESFAHMRQDKYIMGLISKMTKKNLIK